ncbi:MAG: thioredoxin family protein [Methanothrix sp.]|nr:thioredoxin family protein [Methanothrix sp.]
MHDSTMKFLLLLALAAMASQALNGIALSKDWSSYQPAHALGLDDDDWWIVYPSQHAGSGTSVDHPSWVTDALKKKPVIILVHSSTCKPCVEQMENLKEPLATFGSDLDYYDILGEGSGLEKATEVLSVYNPTGGMLYVPTTIFITLIKGPDGEVQVAWHSQVDAMSVDQINAYIKDSIYYYQQNGAEWR